MSAGEESDSRIWLTKDEANNLYNAINVLSFRVHALENRLREYDDLENGILDSTVEVAVKNIADRLGINGKPRNRRKSASLAAGAQTPVASEVSEISTSVIDSYKSAALSEEEESLPIDAFADDNDKDFEAPPAKRSRPRQSRRVR